MPEKEIISHAQQSGISFIKDGTFWTVVFLIITGTLGRVLVSDEPFDLKKLIGEIALSFVGAAILYSYGLLQHMSTPELILYGGLAGLGGVRIIEWGIKIYKAVKSSTG